MRHTTLSKIFHGIGLLGAVLLVITIDGAARAQCSVGDYLGSCPAGVSDAGCCPTSSTVQWCEGTALCGISCGNNPDMSACCATSWYAGCGNAAVENCVCAQDDYCCDTWFGEWDATCVSLATACGACNDGGAPARSCGWRAEESYYDCRPTASADPTGQNPMTCGNACTPSCGGKTCGSNGCGGVCGVCLSTETCNAAGQCVPNECLRNCAGKSCGDDGCGGSCGGCSAGLSCNTAGQCVSNCVPNCTNKTCGNDGCGGTCGSCGAAASCNPSGQCVANCVPSCAGRECGDDGCGGTCGSCSGGASCQAGACVADCVPSCSGRACGDDGCGGSCGSCSGDDVCGANGQCGSRCSCVGKACGDDGCGRVCGYCVAGTTCNLDTLQCDAVSGPAVPDGEGNIAEAESCPQGERWSAYIGACVPNEEGEFTTPRTKDDGGCAGGHGEGGLLLLLGGWLVAMVRCRRGCRGG